MQKNVQILTLDNKKWVTCLEWENLPIEEQSLKVEAKISAEKNNCTYGTIMEYQDKASVGLSPTKVKGISAAQALALANQAFLAKSDIHNPYNDWIVIEEVEDNQFWVSVTKQGLPAPGYDIIFSITELQNNISDILMQNDSYQIFSTSEIIRTTLNGIATVENKGLSQLTEGFQTKLKFYKYKGIPTSVLYGACVFMGLAVGSYFLFDYLDGKKAIEKALASQRMAEEAKKQKEVVYQQKMKEYEAAKIAAEKEALNKVIFGLSGNPTDMLNAWYTTLGNTSPGTHGWSIPKVSCYYQPTVVPAQFACDYLFKRNPLATNRMLLEDYPTAKIDGENALYYTPVNIDPQSLATPDASVIGTLKGASNWNAEMISQLQLLKLVNLDYKFNNSTEITYTIPPKPLSPQEESQGNNPNAPTKVSLGVAQGTLTVKGNNFDFVKEFADNVNFYGTGLRKVDFTISGSNIVWEATFDYFINTRGGTLNSGNSANVEQPNTNNNVEPLPVNQPSVLAGKMNQR